MTGHLRTAVDRAVPVLFVAGALVLWELVVRVGNVSPSVLPPPTVVGSEVSSRFDFYLDNTLFTIQSIGAGLALSLLVASVLAIIIAETPVLGQAVYPLLIGSQAVPVVAIAPLLVMYYGYGLLPKAIIVALISFFPLTINISRGLVEYDRDMHRLVHSLGAGRWWILFHFRVPSALPSVFAGLKISVVLATVGAIVAEWVGSVRGLGYLILAASEALSVELTFGAIAMASALGLLLYGLVLLFERVVMPWR